MLPGASKTSAFTITVQVAQVDYCFRVCLFSRDDVFLSSFRLSWIDRRQIVQCRDATRVCQYHFRVDGIARAEIAQFQSAIRCRRGHPAENSPLTCRSRLFSWWAESSFLRRECLEKRSGASCSALNAPVCHAALVRLSRPAKLSLEVRHYRLVAHLHLLSPRRQYPRQSSLQRQSM
jgi:hypothetical protein